MQKRIIAFIFACCTVAGSVYAKEKPAVVEKRFLSTPAENSHLGNDHKILRGTDKVAIVNESRMNLNVIIPLLHVPMNGGLSLDVSLSNVARDQRFKPKNEFNSYSLPEPMHALSNFSIMPGITSYRYNWPLFLDPKGQAHLFFPVDSKYHGRVKYPDITRYYSRDGWIADLGKYFVGWVGWLTDPEGRRYEIGNGIYPSQHCADAREGILSPLTRIEDVTGHHWIRYEYFPGCENLKLITTSEGYTLQTRFRRLFWRDRIGKNEDTVRKSVFQLVDMQDSDGRKWTFERDSSVGGIGPLSSIHLPDGRSWKFDYLVKYRLWDPITKITYPGGEYQAFSYIRLRHRTNITSETSYRLPPYGKTEYTYQVVEPNPRDIFAKWVEAKLGNKRVRSEYVVPPSPSSPPVWNEGLPTLIETFQGDQLLETQTFTWDSKHLPEVTSNIGRQALLKKHVIKRDGISYTLENKTFSPYGQPTETLESSTLGTRKVIRRYHEDTDRWIFKLKSEEVFDATGTSTQRIERTYNALGQLTSSHENGLASTYTYDNAGNLASSSDALGNTTTYTQYSRGKPGLIQGPGRWMRYIYNVFGHPLKEEDLAHGSEKRYTYDILGRETSMSQTGYDTRYTKWDTPNKGDRTVTQRKKRTVIRQRDVATDDGGVLEHVTEVYNLGYDTLTYTSINRHSLNGHLLAQFETGPDGKQRLKYRYTYDALGRLLEKRYKDAEGNYGVERHQYFGNRTRVSTPIGHWTTYWCQRFADPDQCTVTKIRNAEDHETLIDRDVMGRMMQVEQGGVTHRYTYDPLTHLLMAVHHPESGSTTYQYDSAGRKTSMIRADGQQTTYHYNGAHQLTHIGYPDGRYRDNAYDYGRMTKTENATSQWTYHYKPSGQLREATFTDKETGDAYRFAYEYDPLGPMSKITYPDGRVVDYHPDPLGRPTKVNGIHGLSYTPSGMLIGYHTPAGHHVTIPVDSRLTRPGGLKVTQGNQTLIDVEYLYDVLRVYEVNDHLPAQQHQHKFGYDGTDQLIYDKSPVGDWYYSYDDHGNITSQTYQGARTDYHYNALNRLSALSGNHSFDLSYDALGRVTSRDDVDLSYNAADLVTRMHKDGRTVEYRYDPYGKRYKIIEGDKTSLQLHLKHKLYYEKREGHEIDHVFLKGQHIANIKDNGETTYFFNNLIGSPLLESSDAGQQHQDYNAYGQEHERDTREPHTSFAGKQSSPGFGLVDMHARQYDPVIGRFLAPDPADIDPTKWLTVNRYVYANNSPYMFVDPDGHNAYKWFSDLSNSFNHTASFGLAGTSRHTYSGASFIGRTLGTGVWFLGGEVVGAMKFSFGGVKLFGGTNKVAQSVFWSGPGSRKAAEAYAKKYGGQTLEMTKTGKILDKITTSKNFRYLKPAWVIASRNFANNAQGPVVSVHSRHGVRIESVWAKVEHPILKERNNKINYRIAD